MGKTGKTIALMVGVLLVLAMTLACAANAKAADASKETPTKVQTKCPVMGNPIDKSLFVDKDGKRIYLCCPKCSSAVTKDFAKYAKQLEGEGIDLTIPKVAVQPAGKSETAKPKTDTQTAPADGKTVYTCPMHPDVTSDKPGACPKCGMKLVPKNPAGSDVSKKSASPMSCCK
jgi:hypothetical protein